MSFLCAVPVPMLVAGKSAVNKAPLSSEAGSMESSGKEDIDQIITQVSMYKM